MPPRRNHPLSQARAPPRPLPAPPGDPRGTTYSARRRRLHKTEFSMTSADHSSASDSMTLHHAALYVSDLDQTRAFYTDLLGMEEIPRPADFTFPGAYFRRGGA